MICDEERLLAFLSEDLDAPERARFDDHLLGCEPCWTAVRQDRRGRALAELLREPAPAGLAERIRLVAQAEARPAATPGAGRSPSLRRRWVAGGLSLGAAAALTIGLLFGTGAVGRSPAPAPAARADWGAQATLAVVRLGRTLPMHVEDARGRPPARLGDPMRMSVGTVQLELAWYRVDGGEAVVAHSPHPFAMPAGGTPAAGGRAWTAQMDGVSIYCACAAGGPAAAIVTPMAPHAAMDLAAYLDMPT